MRAYRPSEFSPIYPPDVKPAKVGWYPANCERSFPGDIEKKHSCLLFPNVYDCDFFFWDGEWHDAPGVPAIYTSQDKHWFGLNHEGV